MVRFLHKYREYKIAEAKLREALSLCAPSLVRAGFSGRVEFINECMRNNELGVALETLCENLHEFRLPVSQGAVTLIREAGTIMNVDSRNWELLESLISSRPEVTDPGLDQINQDSDLSDEQIARNIRNSLRGRTYSDSAESLREDRNR